MSSLVCHVMKHFDLRSFYSLSQLWNYYYSLWPLVLKGLCFSLSVLLNSNEADSSFTGGVLGGIESINEVEPVLSDGHDADFLLREADWLVVCWMMVVFP